MIALIIIIVFLLILNLVPIGVDGGYENSSFFLSLKVGPFRVMRILPAPELSEEEKRRREFRKAEKKEKKSAKSKKEANTESDSEKKFDKDLIVALIPMGLHALKRFRHRLSIDLFKIYFVSGGNPYSAAMNYGYISAAFGTILPLLDSLFNIGERDVRVSVDFDAGQTSVDARLILTIQLWEVIYIAVAFAAEFIRYKINNSRNNAVKSDVQSDAA